MHHALTIHVGDNNNNNDEQEEQGHHQFMLNPSESSIIHVESIDSEVENYKKMLEETKQKKEDSSTITVHEAEVYRKQLMILWLRFFEGLTDEILQAASDNTFCKKFSTVQQHQQQQQQQQQLTKILDLSAGNMPNIRDLKAQQTRLRLRVAALKEREQQELAQPLQSQNTTFVGTLVLDFVHLLQQRHSLFETQTAHQKSFYNMQIMYLKKGTLAFFRMYSWLLQQWSRNIREMENTFAKITARIENVYQTSPVDECFEKMLKSYETFLKIHEQHLPEELKLSQTARYSWRNYLAINDPTECLRLIRNELEELRKIPQLSGASFAMIQHLSRYDLGNLQQMEQKRRKLKSNLEYAVDKETERTYCKQWHELTTQLYNTGLQLYSQLIEKLKTLKLTYETNHSISQRAINSLNERINTHQQILVRQHMDDLMWMDMLNNAKIYQEKWEKMEQEENAVTNLIEIMEYFDEIQTKMKITVS